MKGRGIEKERKGEELHCVRKTGQNIANEMKYIQGVSIKSSFKDF